MAVNGATDSQIKQLEAKKKDWRTVWICPKSIKRLGNMLKDSLVSQQTYDETFANIKGR
jgi:HlyD family secretion protein